MANNDDAYDPQKEARDYQLWQAEQAAQARQAARDQLPTTGGMPPPGYGGYTLPTIPKEPPSRYQRDLENRYATVSAKLNPPPPQTGWGKFGRVMGTIGQDIGTAIRPDIMANIPGTTLNRRIELANLGKEISAEEERQNLASSRGAQAQEALAHAGLYGVEAWQKAHPSPTLVPYGEWTEDAEGNKVPTYVTARPGEYPHLEAFPMGQEPQGYPSASPAGGAGLPTTQQPMPPAGAPPPVTGGMPTTPQAGAAGGAGAAQGVMLPKAQAAPPAAAPTQQPQYTFGKTMDEPHFIRQWLRENKLPNTAENIARARAAYTSGGPIGGAQASEYMGRIAAALEGTGIDPAAFGVNANSTKADAERAESEARQIGAPIKAINARDARTMGYAAGRDGQTVYTDRATAQKNGQQFRELTPGMLEQDAQLLRQLDDVQVNVSRYRKAIDAVPEDISYNHALLMQQILSNDKIKAGIAAGVIPGADYILDQLKGTSDAAGWNALSDPEADLLTGYLRARGAVFAYMKALAKSGRSSDRQFQLEEQTIPSPLVGSRVGDLQMDAWQENLDMASRGLPNNFTGVPHPSQIKREVEAEKTPAQKKKAAAEVAPKTEKKGKGQFNPITGKYE